MGLRPAVTVTEYGSVVYPPINKQVIADWLTGPKGILEVQACPDSENDETFLSIMSTTEYTVQSSDYQLTLCTCMRQNRTIICCCNAAGYVPQLEKCSYVCYWVHKHFPYSLLQLIYVAFMCAMLRAGAAKYYCTILYQCQWQEAQIVLLISEQDRALHMDRFRLTSN